MRATTRFLAVLVVTCVARPAFADGALSWDPRRVAALLVVAGAIALAGLLAIVWLLRRIVRWLAGAQPAGASPAQPELPAARTVTHGGRAGDGRASRTRGMSRGWPAGARPVAGSSGPGAHRVS